RHFLGLVSEQCIYNLLTRHVELEVLPAAQAYGIGIIPWSPLHGGALAGALRKQAEGSAGRANSGRADEVLRTHRPAIEAYEKLCADLGHDPADVGIAWLLAQPAVTAPIIGPRTLEQLDASVRALTVNLDEATLDTLDELFPPIGKGVPGPEAWAWYPVRVRAVARAAPRPARYAPVSARAGSAPGAPRPPSTRDLRTRPAPPGRRRGRPRSASRRGGRRSGGAAAASGRTPGGSVSTRGVPPRRAPAARRRLHAAPPTAR